MKPSVPPSNTPLLVTRQAYPGDGWADLADCATQGMQLWRERRHPAVFADFGDLGAGMSGVRFARALRQEADPQTRIFLLSCRVYPSHVVWARANGADDVIARTAAFIAEKLSGLHVRGGSQHQQLMDALIAQVTAALQKHGGLGAAAVLIVQDVIERLADRADGRLPALPAIVTAVASRIRDAHRRLSFIRSFGARDIRDVTHA